jgi:hypothetical protein
MKNHSLLFFSLFICSLVAGYTFSARFYPSNFSLINSSLKVVAAKENKPIAALSTGQRSLLLITASSLSTFDTHLESIWLATYFPNRSDIRLLPIYPSGNEPISDFEAQLVQSFGLNKKNGQLTLDHDFVSALENQNYWWSGYIILDEVAIAGIIDRLGGIELQNQTRTGEQVMAKLPNVLEHSGEAYSYQIALLQSGCKQFAQVTLSDDLSQLSTLLARHILTDLQSNQLRTEFQTLLAGKSHPVCKFPLLEKSQIVQ